jgi:hypothetical protein
MSVMALDIETANYSHEIGGWDKHNLWDISVVSTWDGDNGHIFTNAPITLKGVTIHPLHPRDLGEHLEKHVDGGGKVLGHNLLLFDLPALHHSLDCFYAGELMRRAEECVIDTSRLLRTITGQRVPLDDICKHTLGEGKTMMKSADAPKAWRAGKYDEVAEYCLKDTQLNYNLFMRGRDDGIVKTRDIKTGEIMTYEVIW